MVPSNTALESKLRKAVEEVYTNNLDSLTVRFIRDKVESELDLDAGYFTTPAWKDKSKTIIKEWATKLIDEGESAADPVSSIEVKPKAKKVAVPAKKPPTPVKKGTKRASQSEKARSNKRQKKEETPSDISEDQASEGFSDEGSDVSDFEESDASVAPKSKRQSKSKSRTPVKRGSKKVVVSDESEEEESSDVPEDEESEAPSTPPKKAKKETASRRQSKKAVVESDEESEEERPTKASPVKNPSPKKDTPKKPTPKKATGEVEPKAEDSESEMSVVLDEPPKPKQKRRTKSEMASGIKSAKGEKAPKAAKPRKEPKPAKDLTPQEAEIKTLQSHLVKCGVRKIWGFELKPYGDDSKAKIRHLQGMLKDIGMVGRFSESRAREIKELRELQADLEAVKEGDSKWGLESGRRNRGVRKSFKESTDDDEEGDEDGGAKAASSSREITPKRKMAKAKQELAFLGDEDSSDSD